ncbi:TPA: hypothetical protein ACN359_004491 [Vibrio parahaemolyticus]|uniref:hypothetical protein n=1 Tax=Vibrio parahaemolyticus TaxID=670 RepID=UPI001A23DA48|nr:hypothetical protein [Vibrio parahaemolyticus]HCG9204714.1 hypothetical protein [Vibrio parahaemolyticus]
MKKNNWDVCFSAYMKECTRITIIKDSFKSISNKHKLGIITSGVLFAMFVGLTLHAAITNEKASYNFFFPIFLIFEFITIYLVEKAQTIYKSDKYSDIELSHLPPENYKDQKVRYLNFRRSLKENKIESDDTPALLEILNARIELQKHSRITVQKMFGFTITFSMAILVATMKNVDITTIAQIAAVGLLSVVFLYMFITVKPNKVEQLYELKYFLVMYEKECRVKSL